MITVLKVCAQRADFFSRFRDVRKSISQHKNGLNKQVSSKDKISLMTTIPRQHCLPTFYRSESGYLGLSTDFKGSKSKSHALI